MKFYDTNIFLSHLETLDKEEKVLWSSVTIEELENIKTSGTRTEELRYSARKAVRWLNENEQKCEVIVYDSDVVNKQIKIIEDNNDARILACAKYIKLEKYNDLVFVTDDILCKLIAKTYYGLETESLRDKGEFLYKGYKTISGNTENINFLMSEFDKTDWYDELLWRRAHSKLFSSIWKYGHLR